MRCAKENLSRVILSVFLISPLVIISSACSETVSSQANGVMQVVSSFEECVQAGNRILRTFPARCIHEGVVYVQGDGDSGAAEGSEGAAICRDTCGNGTCEQIVCMAQGCPCAESPDNCPSDCDGK